LTAQNDVQQIEKSPLIPLLPKMKFSLLLLLFFSATNLRSQCPVLDNNSDTIIFEGVEVRYFQVDTTVQIEYAFKDQVRALGEAYDVACDLPYQPAFPRPIWRNEHFICFHRGCGTSCFDHYLAPLNDLHEAQYGGQFLIDTVQTIYMSLLRDTASFQPYLALKNHVTGNTQVHTFQSNDFPVAIMMEYLDYTDAHKNGFSYKHKKLTLYLADQRTITILVDI
jgi:hypothetical protein